jgi:AcrR family transcriptional regulator
MSHSGSRAEEAVSAKASIIGAAVELFARKGFANTSVREIAEAAGVAKPTLYYYFGSKHGLGLAVLKRAGQLLMDEIAWETKAATDPVGKIVGFINAHFTVCRENEALARFVYSLSFAPPESPPGLDVIKVHEEALDVLTRTIDEAVEKNVVKPEWRESATMAVMGIINIHLMHFLVQGMAVDRSHVVRSVKGMLEGVGDRRNG